jgi:hypothetical protein
MVKTTEISCRRKCLTPNSRRLSGTTSINQILDTNFNSSVSFARLDEYREEIEVLKAERDHLEKSNVDLRKKVTDFRSMQTPVSVKNVESVYRNLLVKLFC